MGRAARAHFPNGNQQGGSRQGRRWERLSFPPEGLSLGAAGVSHTPTPAQVPTHTRARARPLHWAPCDRWGATHFCAHEGALGKHGLRWWRFQSISWQETLALGPCLWLFSLTFRSEKLRDTSCFVFLFTRRFLCSRPCWTSWRTEEQWTCSLGSESQFLLS